MTRFHQIQCCVSNQPYYEASIPSRSKPGCVYSVYSPFEDDQPEEYVCSCPGFIYRGRCAHQDMAFSDRCRWNETIGPEQQTAQEQRAFRCPRCGDSTYQVLTLEDHD